MIDVYKVDKVDCEKKGDKIGCVLDKHRNSERKIKDIDEVNIVDGSTNLDLREGGVYSYRKPLKCVRYDKMPMDVDQAKIKSTDMLYCEPSDQSDVKTKWGFDLTSFPSGKDFNDFLDRNNFKRLKPQEQKAGESSYKIHHFKNNEGIELYTQNDGKDGNIGYVGVEVPDDRVHIWERIRQDFKKTASYIKEEEGGTRGFI